MYIAPSQLHSIPTNCENVDSAAAFINYWVNNEEANLFLNGRRSVPINTEIANLVAANLDDTNARVFNFISSELPNYSRAIYPPDPAGHGELEAELRNQVQMTLFGQCTPEEAADAFFAAATKALK